MDAEQARRASAAAVAIGSSLGLAVDDSVVLNNSNKLIVRLVPCSAVARVAPADQQVASFEVELARGLAAAGSPVGALDPRVEPRAYERDGFVVTLWTYYEPVAAEVASPREYAEALGLLHAGMRAVEVPAPHFLERVEDAQRLLADRGLTPELADAERELLSDTLGRFSRAVVERGPAEQLLHGEPHPGNVLRTSKGLLFIDFETCCRGPVEFDLAHAPDDVAEHYPGVDQELLRDCRILMLAMIITWRWDRDDQFPDGRRVGTEWLEQLRVALAGC
ncbi:aminoglycoside phosphotransferase [Kribbella sp. ALI-6-A]|uniref:phosphotransferase enzyme family protein n=1 Tax=Kribbella sp. ALI-6-A TaxID=1933817 RepID=UPI00097BC884|nr:aminoglycoside phosphotransferase family protein [Kribbella sp. ALI-6-A]ONI73593.1 aminoglycoside phosphotransferase [Kribbella sp. ALI-6-A]